MAFAAELLGEHERVARGSHPDLYVLEPLGDQIRIDAIRELRRDLHMRPFEADRRVYLIFGAHSMNEEAADALLKDLEEPPPYAVIVLVADDVGPLPETIRSRCQPVPFRRLSERAIRAVVEERAPGLSENQAAALARVAAGRLDRVERLLDPKAVERRSKLIELARAVYRDADFVPAEASAALIEAAGERAKEARAKAEEELEGLELTDREAEQRLRRAARGAEREELLLALEELAAWYRDLIAVSVGAERAAIHVDHLAELQEDATEDRAASAEVAAEIVREQWRLLEELQLQAPLAFEALFVQLRRAFAGSLVAASDAPARLVWGLAALVAASGTLLLGAATARPALDGPGFFVGFSEDLPRAIGADAVTPARDLGAKAFRFTLQWAPGQTRVADSDVADFEDAIRDTAGMGVVLAVYSYGPNAQHAPKTQAAREQYCAYVRDALTRLPSIRDVVIWNEPNKSLFWSPQSAEAPVAYEALLARCYDVLHAAFPDVNVIGLALSSTGNDDGLSHSPGAFIRAVGEAYRASGRRAPLFDTVGHHPYGFTASERPWRRHIGSKVLAQGDWNKLMYNLWLAFDGTAQPIPGSGGVGIWYMEGGSQTAIDDEKQAAYNGSETVAVVPDYVGGEPETPPPPETSAAPDQHTQVLDTMRLAACQPYVHAYFNFLLFDEPRLGGWQSGAFWADRTPKDSLPGFRQAIAEANSAVVDCGALKGGRPSADFMPPSTPAELAAVPQRGSAPGRAQLEREHRRCELGRLPRLPERRPRGDDFGNGVDERGRRASDDLHVHGSGPRFRRESRRRLGAGDGHDARTSDGAAASTRAAASAGAATTAGYAASARAAASAGPAATAGSQLPSAGDANRHGAPRHSPRHAWAGRPPRPRRRRSAHRRRRTRSAARGTRQRRRARQRRRPRHDRVWPRP